MRIDSCPPSVLDANLFTETSIFFEQPIVLGFQTDTSVHAVLWTAQLRAVHGGELGQ